MAYPNARVFALFFRLGPDPRRSDSFICDMARQRSCWLWVSVQSRVRTPRALGSAAWTGHRRRRDDSAGPPLTPSAVLPLMALAQGRDAVGVFICTHRPHPIAPKSLRKLVGAT